MSTTTEARSAEHMASALNAWSEMIRFAVRLHRAGRTAEAMDHISWYAGQAGVLDGLTVQQEARHG